MSEPYTPGMIAQRLRDMDSSVLATVTPKTFQTWPVRKIVATKIIEELISNERAARRV